MHIYIYIGMFGYKSIKALFGNAKCKSPCVDDVKPDNFVLWFRVCIESLMHLLF